MSRVVRIGAGVAVAAAAVALVLVLPHWLSDAKAAEFARAGCFFIAIVGLNLVTGYTGQISLGHGALMAVGAYTTAILTANHGFRDLWTIPLAGPPTPVHTSATASQAERTSWLVLIAMARELLSPGGEHHPAARVTRHRCALASRPPNVA